MTEEAARVDRAIDDAVAAIDLALDEIEATKDSDERLGALKPLAAGLQGLFIQAAEIRRGELVRLYEEEDLSLAEIGRLVGLSKGRVHQIVSAGGAQRPPEGGGSTAAASACTPRDGDRRRRPRDCPLPAVRHGRNLPVHGRCGQPQGPIRSAQGGEVLVAAGGPQDRHVVWVAS